MKNWVCHLLLFCLALLSGGSNAHSINGATHEAVHAAHEAVHAAQAHNGSNHSSANADGDHAPSDHTATCHQAQCGHGHCTGLLASLRGCLSAMAGPTVALSRCCWASAAVIDNIERPKWPFTTPAVVSLLS